MNGRTPNIMENKIISILKKNGWYENREIDITSILNYLKDEKYTIYNTQINFLKEFGNLEISFKDCNGNGHFIVINPIDVGLPEWAKQKYEIYINKKFILIGEVVCENTFLLMDKDLEIYGAYENEFIFLGKNFYVFLENFYLDKLIDWEIIKNFFE